MNAEDPSAERAEAAPGAVRGVECPLCGYDQEGALAAFRDAAAWPVQGRCPECGLEWFWGDLLHPGKRLPEWFVESLRRAALPAAVRTWRRALRPRRFWQEMRVPWPVRRGRLVLFAALALVLAYVVAAAAGAWMGYMSWAGAQMVAAGGLGLGTPGLEFVLQVVWPVGSGGYYAREGPFGPSVVLALMWLVLMPAPFLLLRDTFMTVRVRRVHLLRIWAYSLAAWPPVVLVCAALQVAVALIRRNLTWGSPGSMQFMWWELTNIVARADWLVVLLTGVWVGWFWWQAIRVYLRLPHARAVVVMMLIASFLGALAIAAYYPGSELMEQIGYWIV